MQPLLKKRFPVLFRLLIVLLFLLGSTQASTAATILISDDYDVDGRSGSDTVNLITTTTGSFKIEIVSSGGTSHDKTYIISGSVVTENIYIENLDGKNGKEIIILYTKSGSRKLSIINRSRDYYTSTAQPEKWNYSPSIISQNLQTDYDSTQPIAISNLVVTNLSGYSGKELIGVGNSGSNNFLFVIRYDDSDSPNRIVENKYTFSGSVDSQFLICDLDNYQGDEVIGFYTNAGERSLYIVNNQLNHDGYSKDYSSDVSFSFGEGIYSSNIQVADSVAHFTTNNVAIANIGPEPGLEIVGIYYATSSKLGLFNIQYPKTNGRVDSSKRVPGNGLYTGNLNRLADARYTIGNFGTNYKEVYGYYNASNGDLGGAFVYWDNFSSSSTYQNLDDPDSNGDFSDSFHEQTSAGKTVASAIYSLIDSDGDNHHDGNDDCPRATGYIDGDGDGVCMPTDQCDSNPAITASGTCGCDTSNQDGDQWFDCDEECDSDPLKRYPGICGCGTSDIDSDGDGTPDCNDGCPNDDTSIYAGECIPDNCLDDPYKYEPGICGCGTSDDDSDGDGAYDCNEECPYDPAKTLMGTCGCFISDADSDGDGKADCLAGSEFETTTFYHTDQTGTPLAVTDSEGRVVWQATYLPFGEEYSVSGPLENNRRFIGKEKDVETGLTYFGARYLLDDRFNSPDPVRLVDPATGKINPTILANPQRLNLYAYGLNNPYRYIDPDGNWAEAVFIEGPSIAAGIHSFAKNIKAGNYGDAAIDAGGIIADGAALLAPGIPGGVGLGIKVARNADEAKNVTTLYQKVDAVGKHLKYGISKNPATRYTKNELAGGRLKTLATGARKDMLRLERELHSTLPIGPEEGQKMYREIQKRKGFKN